MPSHSSPTRERRIDLLRGIAVLAIAANHVTHEGTGETYFNLYKFGHFFTFDFGDVFLLTSGIVAGLVFFPLLLQSGVRACVGKSLRRARQIWIAHILCALAALSVILVFERGLGVTGSRLSPFEAPFAQVLAEQIFLYRPGGHLDILPVYIILLLLLPLALAVYRWSAVAYFAVIGVVWALVWIPVFLIGPALLAEQPDLRSPYFVHPMAAQLLFFTGVAIGIRKREIEAAINTPNSLWFAGAILFLIATNFMHQLAWMTHHFDQKQWVGPLRLAELLAVLVVIARLMKPDAFTSDSPSAIEACGRHVLPVFVATTVASFLFSYLLNWLDGGRLLYGLCLAANVALGLALAHLLERRKTAWRSSSPARVTSPPPLRAANPRST